MWDYYWHFGSSASLFQCSIDLSCWSLLLEINMTFGPTMISILCFTFWYNSKTVRRLAKGIPE